MPCDPITDHLVAVARGDAVYASEPPFAPDEAYPECPAPDAGRGGGPNPGYALVRQALAQLGLDGERFDTAQWNPLRGIVRPGDTVVLKPNLVRDFRESSPDPAQCVTTHGSVIRAVVDYVYLAAEGRGRIVIADAPHNDADFDTLRRITGLAEIQRFYREALGFDLEVYDLRPECATKVDGVIVGHGPLPGDPAGYVMVDVGPRSAFMEVRELCHLLYGSEYDMDELHRHQHDEVHEYLISRTVLEADCVISLPKLKTHKKVGLTVNLKNLVGINGNKNLLPHHREGTPAEGGDQFADDALKRRIERRTVSRFKRVFPLLGPLRPVVAGPVKAVGKRLFGDTNTDTVRSGNWYGNDTTWRMALDLNRILLYADGRGEWHDRPVRRFFSVVDGVIGGEANGPLDPIPKQTGLVLAGGNPVAVDLACARAMGFDRARLPIIYRAFDEHPLPLVGVSASEVEVVLDAGGDAQRVDEATWPDVRFKPHFGWKGHIELPLSPVGSAQSA